MAGGAFTTLDPKDTYLGILSLGKDNDVLHATNLTTVQDSAGNASLLELSQDKVGFAGIMEASVAAGIVMDTGILFTGDQILTEQLTYSLDTDVSIFFTSGDPEGSLTASPGSLALRNDGGAGTSLYIKETGTSNTGWTAVDLVAAWTDLSDTPGAIAADQWVKANAGGTALVFTAAPAENILDLSDAPAAYDDGKYMRSTAAGFELVALPAGTFLGLSDVDEPNYTNDKHALIAVNDAENALEFNAADPDQGDILYYNGTAWTKLPPGTDGKVLVTKGPAANPQWDVVSGAGSNDPDAIHVDVASEIQGLTLKSSPAAGDVVVIEDVADSYNKKKVSVGTLLGNDANAIHDNVSGEINAVTEKATPVDDDIVLIEDSASTYQKKKVKLSNIGGGGLANIPVYGSGSGDLTFSAPASVTIDLGDAGAGEGGRISARDFIHVIKGGEASPTWTFGMTFDFGGGTPNTPTSQSDPTDVYIDTDCDTYPASVYQVKVTVSDGTTTKESTVTCTITGEETPAGP